MLSYSLSADLRSIPLDRRHLLLTNVKASTQSHDYVAQGTCAVEVIILN